MKKRILSLLQSEVQMEDTERRMMAVSGGYRVLYPVSFDDRPEMTEFSWTAPARLRLI